MGKRLAQQVAAARIAFRRLRSLLGDRTAPVVWLVLASVGAGLSEALVLALVAQTAAAMVLNSHALNANLGPVDTRISVSLALILALALSVIRLFFQLVIAWLPASISSRVQAQLRHGLFDTFTRASWGLQAQEREGHLQELMTSQTMQTTQVVVQVISAVSGTVMFLVLVAAAFTLNALVAGVVLISAIVMFVLLRPVAMFGRRSGRELSRANLDHAAGVSEAVRLAEEAQVFGAGTAQRTRVGALIENARRAFFRFWLAQGFVTSIYQGLVFLLIVGGLAGLYFANAGHLAALGAVVLMLVRAAAYAQQFQAGYQSFNQLTPYLDRLQGAMADYAASAPVVGERSLATVGTMAFEHVTFSYGRGQPALRDVSFTIGAGESIGVVGPSGAGKSTLVQVLLRLRDPDDGVYLINGEAARSFRPEDWHDRVAYVSQEPRIMHATVADNIRFFRELDADAVVRAAKLAHIHDEIMALPDRYDTLIGQRADAVSGGQRQRICLARALAGHPDVLVLDEPTSALDMASEAAIQASLAGLHRNVTLFIIAHRVSTLAHCDRVLVMADGAIEDFAPLAELEETSSYYRMTAALARGD